MHCIWQPGGCVHDQCGSRTIWHSGCHWLQHQTCRNWRCVAHPDVQRRSHQAFRCNFSGWIHSKSARDARLYAHFWIRWRRRRRLLYRFHSRFGQWLYPGSVKRQTSCACQLWQHSWSQYHPHGSHWACWSPDRWRIFGLWIRRYCRRG